ncbi:MAG: ABC transporter permease [Candidatus Izemoplasmatales bacterium]|jgi:simple sugar transport system permease protein|nr:ABC transporter permease [Candidatus Izemoplasmatales bacterium]
MKVKAFLQKAVAWMKKNISIKRLAPAAPSFIAIGFGVGFGILTMFIIWLLSILGVLQTYNNPEFFYGISLLLAGGFNEGMESFGDMLYSSAPLILAGLAVAFAFRTGLFNIGVPGQMIAGSLTAVYIGMKISLPAPFHWMLALLGGIVAACVWGTIVGFLKAVLNVHEVVSSIMMNYVAMYTAFIVIKGNGMLDGNTQHTKSVASSAFLPHRELAIFGYYDLDIGIIIAILAVIVIFIILNKTTIGYQLKAVGFNKDASKYAGINTKRNIVISMAISGCLAGLAGAVFVLIPGKYLWVTRDMMSAELMSVGFDGISVALLGLTQPVGVLFAGLFLAYIRQGGYYMEMANYMKEMADVIIAVIIYFSALSTVLYQFIKNRRAKMAKLKAEKIIAKPDVALGGEE